MNLDTQKSTNERNYGIDLLRIVSMIMIPLIHILGFSGILRLSTSLPIYHETVWFLEIASYCSVNTYALISGYVGYGRKQKYSNIIYLYFQVLFYTLSIITIIAVHTHNITLEMIIRAVFPFTDNDDYWYFRAYFCLFFFIPFFNNMIETSSRVTIKKLIITMLFVFSILPTLLAVDFADTIDGYSFLWLAVMYIIGAYIKKYKVSFTKTNIKNLLVYLVFVIVTWLSKLVIELFTSGRFGNYLIKYTSPTIVVCSIFLFLFFKNIKCGKYLIKFIKFFTPLTFGVYLFHTNIAFKRFFTVFANYLSFNPFVMACAVIGTALGIWFISSLIDKVRLIIFNLLHIKSLSSLIEQKAKSITLSVKPHIKNIVKKVLS